VQATGIKIFVRHRYQWQVVLFGDIRQCAFYNGFLYNKQALVVKVLITVR